MKGRVLLQIGKAMTATEQRRAHRRRRGRCNAETHRDESPSLPGMNAKVRRNRWQIFTGAFCRAGCVHAESDANHPPGLRVDEFQ